MDWPLSAWCLITSEKLNLFYPAGERIFSINLYRRNAASSWLREGERMEGDTDLYRWTRRGRSR
jgi:hypothetical protein